jgi:hypothetical protein
LLGLGLGSYFSCVGDWKSYRDCFVGSYNIAGAVHGLQGYSMFYIFYGAPIVLVILLSAWVIELNRPSK